MLLPVRSGALTSAGTSRADSKASWFSGSEGPIPWGFRRSHLDPQAAFPELPGGVQ